MDELEKRAYAHSPLRQSPIEPMGRLLNPVNEEGEKQICHHVEIYLPIDMLKVRVQFISESAFILLHTSLYAYMYFKYKIQSITHSILWSVRKLSFSNKRWNHLYLGMLVGQIIMKGIHVHAIFL